MKFNKLLLVVFTALCFSNFSQAQEGLPIYSDYLTDNLYLLHPSMAGAANCAKIRVTGRQQWFGDEDAPRLLTVSANGRIGDTKSGIGGIAYSDKNGFHSQTGVYLTYAYHLLFSRSEVDLNQLSFGLSAGAIQYKLDETKFRDFDPIIAGIEQSATNFNVDVGFSYNLYNFYAHATVKNLLENEGINFNEQGLSYNNLRTYIFSLGNTFAVSDDLAVEPSFMIFHRDATKETTFDVNVKAYKQMDFGQVWGGLSYRRSLDGAEYLNPDGTDVDSQKLQYITPVLGVDYKQFVFAYTYSYQLNDVVFNKGGFHQFTLGYNFNCRRAKYSCNCPAVN
jgi:type IX secretion system PorP/SprF family membrane protein